MEHKTWYKSVMDFMPISKGDLTVCESVDMSDPFLSSMIKNNWYQKNETAENSIVEMISDGA